MEVKEAEKIVIAKPVASRPSCSSFRSFSELLAGAINASPSNACSETAVTAIRPKTVRFKPVVNHTPVKAETSGGADCYSSDRVLKSDSKSTVVYKPLAKLVSRATVSLLANVANSNLIHQQDLVKSEAHVQPLSQVEQCFSSDLHQNCRSQSETEKIIEPAKMVSENLEEHKKSLPLPANGDRPSYDGYNWRKYGQKQVKGSEYPRSYYKCTHPNCPVKKKVERSLDGQIAEIVYKGEHNHSKPQPSKRNASGGQGLVFASDGNGQDTNHLNERNELSEGRVGNQNGAGFSAHSTHSGGKAPLLYDPVVAGSSNADVATPENSCGVSGDCEEGSKRLEAEDDEPKYKRRKVDNQSNEVGISGESVQEPSIVVQNDSEIIGDGFRWRKYGQKVVKGNPHPRSYYRCTSLKCNVRKYVEKALDDPTAFITTYEGKHNHDMPMKSTNSVASEPDSKSVILKNKS